MTGENGFGKWERLYRELPAETMYWFLPGLDPDVAAGLERFDVHGGTVLDLGTGAGTQAAALAERGFEVTATDISPTAIATAKARSGDRAVAFRVDDVLATRLPAAAFALVLDRGCYHILPPDRRAAYAAAVHRLLAPDGLLFLKTFGADEPRDDGPHRFTPDEIAAAFRPHFTVEWTAASEFHGTLRPVPKALFAVLRRT